MPESSDGSSDEEDSDDSDAKVVAPPKGKPQAVASKKPEAKKAPVKK